MTTRRTLLGLGLALPALASARAQDFPTRPVTVVIGFPPGGLNDLSARVIVQRMSQALGQTIVVENRAGGATAIATTAVTSARPDGYTLLMGASSLAINPSLVPELEPKRPLDVLVPIGMSFRSAFALQIHPSLPARTLPEFLDHAKASPGRIAFGSSGTGAVNHLCLEMMRGRTGIDVIHVPYKGGAQALVDLQANRIQAMFSAVLEALPPIRDGRTRGIAVSSRERVGVLPELPPVADTLPGFDGVFWQGLFAPAGTPEPVLQRLSAALTVATDDAGVRAKLAESGVAVQTGGADVLRETLLADTALWGKVIREGNIRPD